MLGWEDLRREPFRIFFPLGVLLGLIGVNYWFVYALGAEGSFSRLTHAGLQVGGYMGGFILGFLLTALPRFSATRPAASWELALFLALFLAQPLLLFLGRHTEAQAVFAALLLVLAVFAGRRFASRSSGAGPPTEFVWLLIAIGFGLLGGLLVAGGQGGWLPIRWAMAGWPLAHQGFLLAIVLGVGGFMAPRLMGRGFLLANPAGVSGERAEWLRRRRVLVHLAAALVLLVSFLIETPGEIAQAYTLRAAVVTAELSWTTQFYRPPAARDRYVSYVWASLWLIVLGLWAAATLPRYRIVMLHLMFLGGFSLMTFAVGTMVALSHGGGGQRLAGPIRRLDLIGTGMAGAILTRFLAEAAPKQYFFFLGSAAICWSLSALSWLSLTIPYILTVPPPEAFERLHEAAKRRLSP
jgi:uncharacterized protein involved in response to NO